MSINSRAELIAYGKRKLGDGVINIEVSDDQCDDAVNDTLQKFGDNHYDGFRITHLILPVEADEDTYILPDDVLEVKKIYDNIINSVEEPSFTFRWEFMNEKRWIGELDLTGYRLLQEKLKLIDSQFQHHFRYNFNHSTHTIQFFPAPSATENWCLECYRVNNAAYFPHVYDNTWVKSYFIALLQVQWGVNLTKYASVPFPNGSTLNAQDILTRGLDAKEKLETDLVEKYSEPIDFLWG